MFQPKRFVSSSPSPENLASSSLEDKDSNPITKKPDMTNISPGQSRILQEQTMPLQVHKQSNNKQSGEISVEGEPPVHIALQQVTYQSVSQHLPKRAINSNRKDQAVQLMLTHSDDEQLPDESTKFRRGLSKSDQKDARNRNQQHFAKIITAGPSPMSFGNMIDEILDTDQDEDISKMQVGHLFENFEERVNDQMMAGDQAGSNPSQSGGSCSEQRAYSFSYAVKQEPQKNNTGILKTSLDNLSMSRTVSFKNRLNRAATFSKKSQKSKDNKYGHNDPKNASVISALSRVTSNNNYSVKTLTGETPQNIQGKLPSIQKYFQFETIDQVEKMKKLSLSQNIDKVNNDTVAQNKPFFLRVHEGHECHKRMHSPVLEQHTMEQYENTYSSYSPPHRNQDQPSNRAPNRTLHMNNLSQQIKPKVDPIYLSTIDENMQIVEQRQINSMKNQDNSAIILGQFKNQKKIDDSETSSKDTKKKHRLLMKGTQSFQNVSGPSMMNRQFLQSEKIDMKHLRTNTNGNLVLEEESSYFDENSSFEVTQHHHDKSLIRTPKLLINDIEAGGASPKKDLAVQGSRKTDSNHSKQLHRLTSGMSQADSYFPEFRARMTKKNIFGDPWDIQNRNKNLIAELMKGNTQQDSEKLSEQATIIFNENPNKGIQFCLDSKLFKNRENSIVKFLLHTSGLSKFAIGQYLASPKEMNQKVLALYASRFQYKAMPIDEALRMFLATFRLPGEGDQIQRIIEKFSLAFRRENPEHFDNEDEAFLLAYCLIFLNTLNHNANVDPKHRLTLEQFIKQCSQGAPRYPKVQLEQIYERVCTNQFKTDTQDIERILGRVGPFFNLDPEKPLTKDQDIQMVQRGQTFIKYGRRGQPHNRFVYISSDEKYLVWCVKNLSVFTSSAQPTVQAQAKAGKNPGATTPGKESKIRRVLLAEISDIKVGISSTNVLKRHNLPKELDSLCMSVIAENRTLDLKANDLQTRNKWVQYFYDRVLKDKLAESERPSRPSNASYATAAQGITQNTLNPFIRVPDSEIQRKHLVSNRYSAYQRACNNDEQQLEEIWVHKVMTNIEAHWDYVKNRPKLQQSQIDKQKIAANKTSQGHRPSIFNCFGCVGSKTSQTRRTTVTSSNLQLEKKHYEENYQSPAKHQSKRSEQDAARLSVNSNRMPMISEGSQVENLQASPYLSNLLSNQKLQSSARGYNSDAMKPYNAVEINLEDLWRFGIPVSIRRVLWPFKIGNKLGISKQLYQINKQQGIALKRNAFSQSNEFDFLSQNEESQRQQSQNDTQKQLSNRVLDIHTLTQIHQDIEQFFDMTDCFEHVPPADLRKNMDSDDEIEEEMINGQSSLKHLVKKKESLMHLILSFLIYRPDVGYVKYLSFLAGTLLVYCDEANAFICFANFVHESIFIKLFRGYIQDIKLRIDLFDSYFQEKLPELQKHFEALEIDTAFFLTDWFVTVFVKNMDFKIACRIWDNMILDGEIFVFKTGLAILSYFQSKFLKQCHFQIKEQLSDMRGLVEEHQLFAIIEDQIQIDEQDFLEKCQSQTWGHQKAKLLGFASDYLNDIE